MLIKDIRDSVAPRGFNTPAVAMVTKRLLSSFESEPIRGELITAVGA